MRRLGLSLFVLLAGSLACVAGTFMPTKTPTLNGTRATVDLPVSQQMRNTGGIDGSGLCVFTSIEHTARWQNVTVLNGFRKWMERKYGGGWPDKVDKMLAAYCREKGVTLPDYVQHTGGDAAFLDLAIKTGRCPCVTYAGMDDFYRFGIDHMVNLAALDSTSAAIIDNNRPGNWVWMSRADFLARWKARGGGWAIVLLEPPPPPYSGPVDPAMKSTSCECAATGKCKCWEGECVCPACAKRSVEQCPNCPDNKCPAQPANPLLGGRLLGGPLTGVDATQVHAHPTYSRRGRACTEGEAMEALADDSDHWHLSVVGDPTFHQGVAADIDKLPAGTRAKLLVQYYAPGAWPVSQYKLAAGVTLRKPAGSMRVSGDVGVIPAAGYCSAKLADLIGAPTGPDPKPIPPPPPPAPPAPTPAPPTPDATPAPAPLGEVKPCCLALLILWLAMRRKAAK